MKESRPRKTIEKTVSQPDEIIERITDILIRVRSLPRLQRSRKLITLRSMRILIGFMKGVKSKYQEFQVQPDYVVTPKLGPKLNDYLKEFRQIMGIQ